MFPPGAWNQRASLASDRHAANTDICATIDNVRKHRSNEQELIGQIHLTIKYIWEIMEVGSLADSKSESHTEAEETSQSNMDQPSHKQFDTPFMHVDTLAWWTTRFATQRNSC